MPVTREDIRDLLQGAVNTPDEFYQDVVRLHKKLYWTGMLSLMALITIDVVMSYVGLPVVVSVINIALMLTLGFYVSSPVAFINLFAVGAGWKLTTYNWEWRKLFEEGKMPFPDISASAMVKQGWDTYVATLKLPSHFLIIAIAIGTTLALVRVEHPTFALMFFPTLAAIGLWTFVHGGKPKWYRKITIAVLVVGSVVSLYQMFGAHEKMDKIVHGLFYKKTLELEVANLQPQKLCGVQPGHRKFSIPENRKVLVRINGENTDITSVVRVNTAFPDEGFDTDECPTVSFAVNDEAKGWTIPRQIIAIVFR